MNKKSVDPAKGVPTKWGRLTKEFLKIKILYGIIGKYRMIENGYKGFYESDSKTGMKNSISHEKKYINISIRQLLMENLNLE